MSSSVKPAVRRHGSTGGGTRCAPGEALAVRNCTGLLNAFWLLHRDVEAHFGQLARMLQQELRLGLRAGQGGQQARQPLQQRFSLVQGHGWPWRKGGGGGKPRFAAPLA